jgi:WD40 repeat protein
VLTALFSPDGSRLVTASDEDFTARLWQVAEAPGAPRGTLVAAVVDTNQLGLTPAIFSPDGRRLVTGSPNHIQLWNVDGLLPDAAPESPLTIPGDGSWVKVLLFAPDNQHLILGTDAGGLSIWDATTGQQQYQLHPAGDTIASATLAPDGNTLFSASAFQDFMSWDISQPGNPEGPSLPGVLLAAAPNGDLVGSFWANGEPARLSWWTVNDSIVEERRSFPIDHPGAVVEALSPDLTQYATVSATEARVWDAHTGWLLSTIRLDETYNVWAVSFSPDGRRLTTSHELTAVGGGSALVWDIPSGRRLLELTGHAFRVFTANYSPDGRHIATASRDGTAQIWDAATGASLYVLAGHTAAIYNAVFTPDSRLLVTASGDSTLKVWEVESGQLLRTILSPDGLAYDLAISPHGRLAAATSGPTTRAWDLSTGEELFSVPGERPVFGAGGLHLFTADLPDQRTYGYYTNTQDLVQAALAQVTRGLTAEECDRYLHLPQCPTEP